MVDSCRECQYCKDGLEQYCEVGNVLTYNSPDKYLGGQTFGGYSESITVDESFALRVPKNLDLAATAPLLCAGITTYSPLKHWNAGPRKKVGVVGIGGLGHMAVKLSAELIFDQGLGDIFSCRIAGNILNKDILGSMEFACKIAGSKIIVVLGHTKCGAIKGACDDVKMGNLSSLLSKVKPAVEAEVTTEENRNGSNPSFVENVAKLNVLLTLKQIPEQSPVVAELIKNGKVILVGAIYNVQTGIVDFFEDGGVNENNFTRKKEASEIDI